MVKIFKLKYFTEKISNVKLSPSMENKKKNNECNEYNII